MGNQNSNPAAMAAQITNDVQRQVQTTSPQTTYDNAKKTYTNARNKLWNAQVSLGAHNEGITENEWKKKWSINKISSIIDQWENITNGSANELSYMKQYNLFLVKYKGQLTEQLNEINEQLRVAKINSESNDNKVSTMDRNSFIHLEDYKNRLNVFHTCKKIILFLIICIALLVIIIQIQKKM